MNNLIKFLNIYAPAKRYIILGMVLASVTMLANIILLGLSGWFLAAMGISGLSAVYFNYFTPAAVIRAMAIIRTSGRYAERLVTHDAALRMTALFRLWFFKQLSLIKPCKMQDIESTSVFTRLRLDIDNVEKFYLSGFLSLSASFTAIITLCVVVLFYCQSFGLVLLLFVILVGIIFPLWRESQLRTCYKRIAQAQDKLRQDLAESLQAREEWLVYGVMNLREEKIKRDLIALNKSQNKINQSQLFYQCLFGILSSFVVIAALILIMPILSKDNFSLALIASVPLFCFAFFELTSVLSPAVQSCFQADIAAGRIFEITDQADPDTKKQKIIASTEFDLEFNDVSFSYNDRQILTNFNLEMKKGDRIALCGASGTGKTTVIDLITGYQTPQSGQIILNDTDLNQANIDSVHSCFSVVTQKPYIFAGSFFENLTLGCPDAKMSDILDICEKTGLAPLINSWPQGVHTFVGEHGYKLSGGELRRLAIARALLKPAVCLILDEPTEGLDKDLEKNIMQNILTLTQQRSQAIIFCIHQLENIPAADFRIINLD
jgi:ATP-binding cassette subfamily C protein CydC